MPLGKSLYPTFHILTSNNLTHSTKPWVRALLLNSCQSLIVERNPFTILNKALWIKEPS